MVSFLESPFSSCMLEFVGEGRNALGKEPLDRLSNSATAGAPHFSPLLSRKGTREMEATPTPVHAALCSRCTVSQPRRVLGLQVTLITPSKPTQLRWKAIGEAVKKFKA